MVDKSPKLVGQTLELVGHYFVRPVIQLKYALHYSPDLIIHGVHIWAVWGPLVRRNEVWHLSA